jgi:hypothetical protein
VPPEEQERRLVDPSRREFAKLKSVDLLRELRTKFDIGACEAAMPEPDLTIDTAAMAPAEAAQLIVDTLGLPGASSPRPSSG